MQKLIKEKISTLLDNLKAQMGVKILDLNEYEFVAVDTYKKGHTPPTSGWGYANNNTIYSGIDTHYWLRKSFKTPKADKDSYIVLSVKMQTQANRNNSSPQGLIYLNGKMVQGLDINHSEVYLEENTEYEMYDYFYNGMTGENTTISMAVYQINTVIEKLYYDIKVAYDSACLFDENSDEYISVMTALDRATMLIDMREIYSDKYYKSIADATEYVGREIYEKLCSTKGKPVVSCIGHSHIDVEWLWTRHQTREKIQRTFSTAKSLMDKYPEYKFMLSQPELYRYLKEEAPEKYEELKKLIADGRWETEGAMYLEADCNLISGESFVRQMLQGIRFFEKEFGKRCKVLFLPDVFGYNAAMPQIIKKCGLDYFVTSKISWNDTNTFPYDAFMWEGIDGSKVFTKFITSQNYNGYKFDCKTTYNSLLTPSQLKGAWNRFQQKDYMNTALDTFGFGDGGGGPTKDMLETFRRLEKGLPGMPVAKMVFLSDHLAESKKQFDENCKLSGETPQWTDNLYLEFHRGTYTSMAKNKCGNRKSELALQSAEALSYTDSMSGGKYDSDGLYNTWNKVLHDQFHDIIPGSSIKAVYDITDEDYKEILGYTNTVIHEKLTSLAGKISANDGYLVYNPSGFERTCLVDLDGKLVESNETIPSFGWKTVKLDAIKSEVTVNSLCGENKYYRMTLDKAGRIVSLYDKRADREVFVNGKCGNEFQVFEDYPAYYDNWEISEYYKQKMWVLDEDAQIEPFVSGTTAGFKVTKKYMNSDLVQYIRMYSNSPRIDFETRIDWHQQHQLLKVSFPLDINAKSASYDIQFGHIIRPISKNTCWERAQFEVCAHKWVDMSEHDYGFALLNDCKYGHSNDGSTLKLTILKSGTYPNEAADQGEHVFTYSIMTHEGDFRECGVIKEAYSLNLPLMSVKANGNGTLPNAFSLVSTDKENIVIETVKKAEDDDGMIVRFYEAFNKRTKAKIFVPNSFKSACLVNLLEEKISDLDIENGAITLDVKPFEIISLKFN